MEFKKIWKHHLLVIVIVILIGFLDDYFYGGYDRIKQIFTYPFFLNFLLLRTLFFSIYFFNFYWLSPKTLKQKKIVSFSVGVLLLFIVFASLRYLFEEIILFNITGFHNYGNEARGKLMYYFFDNSYFALKAILYSTSLYLFFQYNKNKSRIHELEIEHKKAEVSYLKSQISPHFLFNTLNAFYVELIDDKPETAKDIHKLSELLRFVTYESQDEFLSLKSEIKFLEDYIYFYYKRFENELFVNFNINGLIKNQQIPSLILIHFVENVFKHGIINDKNNPAKINITIDEKNLELTTKNKFTELEKYTSKGIGSSNIKRRLAVLFNTNYELQYSNENDYFTAYLKMPL